VHLVERLVRAGGHDNLILAGNPVLAEHMRTQLSLPPKTRVLDVLSMPANTSLQDAAAAALNVFVEFEESESRAIAARLVGGVRRRGLAVTGGLASLQALRQGAADMLVIAKGFGPDPLWGWEHGDRTQIQERAPDLRAELVRVAGQQSIPVEVADSDELRYVGDDSVVNLSEEIARLRAKSESLTRNIFSSLTAWQITQLARHPQRPYTMDYLERIFTDFSELHGDRAYADDPAIVGGVARLDGQPLVVIGHQKGRDTNAKVRRNFGMPKPEGYRKAMRLMRLAARFRLPVVTMIDTPGAYPGVGAEERGQSEAIARNLFEMAHLPTPIVSVVIGEGGSGGALAIGVGDRIVMLQYSIYSVISPEGCASILWKSADKAEEAAEAMGLTADRLRRLGLVDEVLQEPLGGAHRDVDAMAETIRNALVSHLDALSRLAPDDLVTARYERIMAFGRFEES